MSDWWKTAPVIDSKQPEDWWAAAPVAEKTKPYSGSVLPFTKGEDGKVRFDSNAGLFGMVKRAVTLPGDAYAGKVDMRRPGEISDDSNQPDEFIARALDLAGMVSPVNPAIRAGGLPVPGVAGGTAREKVKPPSRQALEQAAETGYNRVRDMGVDYRPDAVANAAGGIRQGLNDEGILGILAPKTHAIIDMLAKPPSGATSAPLSGIEAARRAAGKARRDFANPTEQEAGRRLVEGIDQFVMAADPASVMAGPAAAASRELANARGNSAAAFRSERLTDATERAELNAAVANSGQNSGNAIRQRARDILVNPKQSAGFNPEELAALEQVARGSASENTLRVVGNILGGGGGLGAVVSGMAGAGAAGAAGAGPVGATIGAGVPVVGMLAKQASNALTSRRMSKVDELTRSRSPLYEEMAASAPQAMAVQSRVLDPIVRALMASQSGSGENQNEAIARLLMRGSSSR